MSLPWCASARIALLTPVSTVAQAIAAAAAGAQLVDAGRGEALVEAIRSAAGDLGVCADAGTADIVRDAEVAAARGAGLICRDPAAAAAAVRRGIDRERIVVQADPGGIGAAARSGWATMVDLDPWADSLARTEAVAAVCAWMGVSVLRTRHVAQVRRCADMTESVLGRRPPAFAVRGLA